MVNAPELRYNRILAAALYALHIMWPQAWRRSGMSKTCADMRNAKCQCRSLSWRPDGHHVYRFIELSLAMCISILEYMI